MCSIAWRAEEVEAAIKDVADAGYEGIELWGPHIEKHMERHATLDHLRETLAAAGLVVPMVSPYFDFAARARESLATAKRFIGYAASLGSPLVRLFAGGGASAEADEEVWEIVVKGIRDVCDMARDLSISFAIEVHENHLHDSTATTLRLLEEVSAPNLVVNLDIFNLFQKGENPLEALDTLFPYTRILHLKNWSRQEDGHWAPVCLAEGPLDYSPFLRRLAELGYDGFVSVEWFGPDPCAAAHGELKYLRQVLS
jgi:3-dehydroshikimate dehydratase